MESSCGVNITQETVRKWFSGESRPRPKMIACLSLILGVDEAWLSLGSQQEISDKQVRQRNVSAGGAVNVVAGFIQLHGGHPAFPAADDERAKKDKIDLYAIIKGAQYALHIAIGDDKGFIVPASAERALVLGFKPAGEFDFELVELDWDSVTEVGKRIGGSYIVPYSHYWRPIINFKNRLWHRSS